MKFALAASVLLNAAAVLAADFCGQWYRPPARDEPPDDPPPSHMNPQLTCSAPQGHHDHDKQLYNLQQPLGKRRCHLRVPMHRSGLLQWLHCGVAHQLELGWREFVCPLHLYCWNPTRPLTARSNVKSFANANLIFTPKRISAISTIPSTVRYSYSGTSGAVANVAYDIFLASTAGSSTSAYEIMIWVCHSPPFCPLSFALLTIAARGVWWCWPHFKHRLPNRDSHDRRYLMAPVPGIQWLDERVLVCRCNEPHHEFQRRRKVVLDVFGHKPGRAELVFCEQ